jgi:hypothetical protein
MTTTKTPMGLEERSPGRLIAKAGVDRFAECGEQCRWAVVLYLLGCSRLHT